MSELNKFQIDRDNAIKWARKLFEDQAFVILDTETTGLSSRAEIMQLAFVNHNASNAIQFDVRPTKDAELSDEAFKIHGITLESVETAPPITLWAENITDIIKGKTVIAWNAPFDYRLLIQSFNAWHVEPPALIHLASFECAMLKYSAFVGDWDAKRGQYRWQKLPGATHGALADCHAVLAALREMAQTRLSDEPDPAAASYQVVIDLLNLAGVTVTADEVAAWSEPDRIKAAEWANAEHMTASGNHIARLVKPAFLSGEVASQAEPAQPDTAGEVVSHGILVPEHGTTPDESAGKLTGDEFANAGLYHLLITAGEHVGIDTIAAWPIDQRVEAIKYAADLAVARLSMLLGQEFTEPARPEFFPPEPEIDIPF